MSNEPCEFNPSETCEPLACLARTTGTIDSMESRDALLILRPNVSNDDPELAVIRDIIERIMLTLRDCAYKKVTRLKDLKDRY